MLRRRIDQRLARRLAQPAGAIYLALVCWLMAAAARPDLVSRAPAWLAWLADPMSSAAMTVVFVLAVVTYSGYVVGHGVDADRAALVAGAFGATSAILLGLAAYLPCDAGGPWFWQAVISVLVLFVGGFENPFAGGGCGGVVPLGLQVARMAALSATAAGFFSLLFTISRGQLDRLALRLARRLVVIVGLDDDALGLLAGIIGDQAPGERTVVLAGDPGRESLRTARALGAIVLPSDPDRPDALLDRLRQRIGRVYLLSADEGRNRARAQALRDILSGAAPGGPDHGDGSAPQLTVVVRVDDPWHAEEWRRGFIGDPQLAVDAIGLYEETADAILEKIAEHRPGLRELVVVGDAPLTLALLSELSQRGRESEFIGEGEPATVTVIAPDADALLADHALRQSRFATDPLVVRTITADPGAEPVLTLLGEPDRLRRGVAAIAVVVTDEDGRIGTRVALRHPDCLILEPDRHLTGIAAEPALGSLYGFGYALAGRGGKAQDGWERAARAVHERYRRRFPDAPLAGFSWEDLPEFYRESNRRQVQTTLRSVRDIGRSWRPTTPEPHWSSPPNEAEEEDARILSGRLFFDLSEEELGRLAALEHASWLAHHRASGWRAGERDDAARTHPNLVAWADLPAEARRKTEAGVIDTLSQLRALGYRSVRTDDATWATYERVGQV
ncbi:MAG: RyR domain-containing protein, partial [Propionicimonas sp.]